MTDEPEKIWTLAGNRQHWQNVPPQDGQKTWRWVEYTRSDIADTLRAEVARLRAALEHSKTGWENVVELELLDPAHKFTAIGLLNEARAALAHREADQ